MFFDILLFVDIDCKNFQRDIKEPLFLKSQFRFVLISLFSLTLVNILDERGKELFCEGHRRNDVIRVGTGDKPFWGMGQTDMTGVPTPNDVQNIFPIPQDAISSNPNLESSPQ